MTGNSELWRPINENLALSRDDVHVWRASLEQSPSKVDYLAQTLSTDERSRADRFYFEKDKKRFIVGRGLLRTILGYYLDIQPHHVKFTYGSKGKPALEVGDEGCSLEFNLSHSQGMAVYAIARDRKIGIDIEHKRTITEVDQLAKNFFSARENTILSGLSPSQKQEMFFHCWTSKEAYLKAIGEGLTKPLDEIEVSLAIGEPPKLLSIAGDPQEAQRWCLHSLTPAADYVATLAVEGHGWRLSCWE